MSGFFLLRLCVSVGLLFIVWYWVALQVSHTSVFRTSEGKLPHFITLSNLLNIDWWRHTWRYCVCYHRTLFLADSALGWWNPDDPQTCFCSSRNPSRPLALAADLEINGEQEIVVPWQLWGTACESMSHCHVKDSRGPSQQRRAVCLWIIHPGERQWHFHTLRGRQRVMSLSAFFPHRWGQFECFIYVFTS